MPLVPFQILQGGAIPGVRLCRYGISEDSRTSGVFAVYDSPEALQALLDALVTRGRDLMADEVIDDIKKAVHKD